MPTWVVTIPVRTVSEANKREHWQPRSARTEQHKQAAVSALAAARVPRGFMRDAKARGSTIAIKLVRLGVGKMDPDNLAGSNKHVQDGIAYWGVLDDGDDAIEWSYRWEKSATYAVRVEITLLAPGNSAAPTESSCERKLEP